MHTFILQRTFKGWPELYIYRGELSEAKKWYVFCMLLGMAPLIGRFRAQL
jgi:hypothetical protein